tara:strand:- start:148 stop:378 length:231 start_codon:yes stop_codon:yes gene_type:complete
MSWKNEIKKSPETFEKVRQLHMTTEEMQDDFDAFRKAIDYALVPNASSKTIDNVLRLFKELEMAFKDVESDVNKLR